MFSMELSGMRKHGSYISQQSSFNWSAGENKHFRVILDFSTAAV